MRQIKTAHSIPAQTAHSISTGRLPQKASPGAGHFTGSVIHGFENMVCNGQGKTHARTVWCLPALGTALFRPQGESSCFPMYDWVSRHLNVAANSIVTEGRRWPECWHRARTWHPPFTHHVSVNLHWGSQNQREEAPGLTPQHRSAQPMSCHLAWRAGVGREQL